MGYSLCTILVPMYISEVAPLNLRGGLGTVNQLAVTIGLLLSQILGLEEILGTEKSWPLLLGLTICPSVLQLALLPFCPESPRFLLITRQREEESRAALRRLRNSVNVEDDISMLQLITSWSLRLPLIIAIVMQLSQQLSGINAVFYYSMTIFKASGLTEESARYANLGVGAAMVIMTIISIPLMDRAGRRTLHLYGLGGMFIFSIFITISLLVKIMVQGMKYLSVISVLGYVVFFAVGPGSIPWLISAELFSQGPRPAAMSIATLVNWFSNGVVGLVFLHMHTAFDDYTFLPFTFFLGLFWIFTYKKVPETKNKTFDEIAAIFRPEGANNINSLHGAGKSHTARENSSLIVPLADYSNRS
uniref:Major facilitator superfamily (MFS) profile domain-containing protein n=1 Tax=Strigamia maritima TaxID=126957 RepID=T1JM30_STRMM